jgi:hypothetical protein
MGNGMRFLSLTCTKVKYTLNANVCSVWFDSGGWIVSGRLSNEHLDLAPTYGISMGCDSELHP